MKITVVDNRIVISGNADRAGVENAETPRLELPRYEVELGAVENPGSIFLAWLVDWQSQLIKGGVTITLLQIPLPLQRLIALYKLGPILNQTQPPQPACR